MRAVILAGGKGTRLKPYTILIPKPLVPIGEKHSILEIVIKQLIGHGFDHITLAVNHLSKLIMAYFGDGKEFGIKIDYSIEESELSTIGPLTLIDDLPENFLVMNGDILSDINYTSFVKSHIEGKNLISISSFKREVNVDFGVLTYNSSNQLTAFQEKPIFDYNVSMGIYCLNRSVLEDIPKNKPYGFDNLMCDSIKNNKLVNIYNFDGFWLDVGRPSDYEYANNHCEEILKKLKIL